MRALLPDGLVAAADPDGHCYLEALAWLDKNRLKIRVCGRAGGIGGAFSEECVFDLSTKRFEKAVGGKGPNEGGKDAKADAARAVDKPAGGSRARE